MRNKTRIFSALLVFLFLPIFTLAQESREPASQQDMSRFNDPNYEPTEEELGEAFNAFWEQQSLRDNPGTSASACFDYYRFQSVKISLGNDKGIYKSGDKVGFVGKIINENDYPVFDGNVFVRISRRDVSGKKAYGNVVDEFFAMTDVVLDSKEQRKVALNWTVPEFAGKGNYQADFFFSVGKKFNLAGLPFSNEVVAASVSFAVDSDKTTWIDFKRRDTKLNGEKYNHIGNWPNVDSGQNVEIVQPIVNMGSEARKVEVQYDLFAWDSLLSEDLIETKKEFHEVAAGSSTDLKFSVKKPEAAVNYLRITAKTQQEKVIVNIRFVSPTKTPRINFPAINKFPLRAGDGFVMFSCFHNTSNANAEGKLTVELKDEKGNVVGSLDHQGQITSRMMGKNVQLQAKKDYDYLKLGAKIFDGSGKVVDQYEVEYDCKKIGQCSQAGSDKESGADGSTKDWLVWGGYAILGVVIIVLVAIIVRRKRRDEEI